MPKIRNIMLPLSLILWDKEWKWVYHKSFLMNSRWQLVIPILYGAYETHSLPEICLGSVSRLLVHRLEKHLSFPLYKNSISTFLPLTHVGIYLLTSIFCFFLGTFPPSFKKPWFYSIFPSRRKVRRKGRCVFLFSPFSFKNGTHMFQKWVRKIKIHDTNSKHCSWWDS